MRALVSRRFDGCVSANVALAAIAGPLRRWRPHPSNPPPTGSLSSSLMSANRRLTELREIGPLAQTRSEPNRSQTRRDRVTSRVVGGIDDPVLSLVRHVE